MVDLTGSEGGFEERRLTAGDGLALYYRDYGDPLSGRAPVLCLGGLTRNSKDFHAVALRLARKRRVVCLDYRGRGRSARDPDWRNYHPRVYADDVRHLMAAAGLRKVVIIGTSLGGVLAAVMALVAPSAMAGAVLNDIGPDLNLGALDPLKDYLSDPSPLQDWDAAVRRLRETTPGLPANTDAEWLNIARNTYRVGEDGLLYQDWDPAIAKPLSNDPEDVQDLWPLFGALRRVPTAVIRGEISDLFPAASFEKMGERFPNHIRATVPGVGHAPHLGEPQARDAIDRVLRLVDGEA